eukprot:4607811-Karenia_brevis.AAC.1
MFSADLARAVLFDTCESVRECAMAALHSLCDDARKIVLDTLEEALLDKPSLAQDAVLLTRASNVCGTSRVEFLIELMKRANGTSHRTLTSDLGFDWDTLIGAT